MIQLLVPLLSLLASTPDSLVLCRAREKLSDRDTVGAIDLLQDWSEAHVESPAVAGLLDFLQLPEPESTIPPPDTAKPWPLPRRDLWSILAEGVFHPDRDLPALGGLDLTRKFPLSASVGSTNLLAGISGGSWLEGTNPYADADLWTGIEFRRPDWYASIAGWGGWMERNLPEAGISGEWQIASHLGAWEFRNGPMARFSWRLTRYLGWTANATRRSGTGSLDLGGSLRWRQDPAWPSVPDFDSSKATLARSRLQATLQAALTRIHGTFAYGPESYLDGRISTTNDHWRDSTGTLSEDRSDLAFTAGGLLRWAPSHSWSAQGELGWTFVARWGEPELDLSPFEEGPFLRLTCRSDF
ncbi:MAG TPA: hypothetical protein VN931_04235 [Fibrobacteria bacterium]|nr:hypothetical protein [Fibrobacteria bacterium]